MIRTQRYMWGTMSAPSVPNPSSTWSIGSDSDVVLRSRCFDFDTTLRQTQIPASDVSMALASGISSLYSNVKMKSLERKNEDLRIK